jgi:polyvinyl alcohol dehydrogenase (cytochrome)
VSNNDFTPHLMTAGPGAGTTVRGGFWAALDAATGALVWENAATKPPVSGPAGTVAINTGMVTVANGVVLGGSMDANGTMYAFNAATGQQLWSFESGGSVNSGAAVVDGNVYWGSGYANFDLGTPNNKLYSFGVPGKSMARLGLAGPADQAVAVYPTPATQSLQIVSKDRSLIRSVRVYDLAGRLVKELGATGTARYALDVRAVPAGTYLVKIATPTGSTSAKVVVMH